MDVQQMIMFISVCTETRAAEKRMKTQSAKASAYQCCRLHMSTWWHHTDSDTHLPSRNVSLIFSHIFSLHRPVVHVEYFLFLSPSGEAVRSEPLWTWSNVSGGSWRLPVPLPTWMDGEDLSAGSVGQDSACVTVYT